MTNQNGETVKISIDQVLVALQWRYDDLLLEIQSIYKDQLSKIDEEGYDEAYE